MTETRFPSSGLSAEYGDILLSGVTSDVLVSVEYAGQVVLDELYKPDAAGVVCIKGIGELAMNYFSPSDMRLTTGVDYGPVVLGITLSSDTTISKDVTFYPCGVDFSSNVSLELLKQIPLSRATVKNTAVGRKEFISFWGGSPILVYAVYRGESAEAGVGAELVSLSDAEKVYVVDVSPAVVSALIGKPESTLVYYNVYKYSSCILRYYVSRRYCQYEKTFVFRNCFGAQESFTCTGDEKSERKWTREYGDVNEHRIDFSRKMERTVKVNTGYLTRMELELVEDLLQATDLCVLVATELRKVTILSEDFDETSRRDELNSVTFTYRLAQHNQFKTSYEAFAKPRVFSASFDKTFD